MTKGTAERFDDKGLNWFVTGLFIVAQLAGGGIVALPTALIQSGLWIGTFLNILLTVIAATTSIMLGKCWVILQRRWPATYRDQYCREPYPEMCARALGPKFRNLVSLCIQLNQFGISVVFLLLSSKNIHHFLYAFFALNVNFCLLILILALLLFPFTLLKSPEDFWWAAIVSACTTTFAVVLICAGAIMDAPVCAPHAVGPPAQFHVTNYFLALGTILFAYGGHPGFPTIQHDMKRAEEFTKSSILAFSILSVLYLPVCLLAYFTYGNSLRESVMNSIQHVWIQHAASFLITGHAIFTIIIVINPINQIAEKRFNIPQAFGVGRLLVRGSLFALVVFVAETVPTFGPLLDLIGGSTQTSCALVYPCLCFLFLQAAAKLEKERQANRGRNGGGMVLWTLDEGQAGFAANQKYKIDHCEGHADFDKQQFATINDVFKVTDRKVLFACTFIIAFAVLGGSAATFSAIRGITTTHFVPPCYMNLFTAAGSELEQNTTGHVNCCGPYQNISLIDAAHCSQPDLHFYD